MYLGAATNNKAETALGFFLEAVEKHGVPSRYVCTFEYILSIYLYKEWLTDCMHGLKILIKHLKLLQTSGYYF